MTKPAAHPILRALLTAEARRAARAARVAAAVLLQMNLRSRGGRRP
jgi:hypothetical protein